MVPVDPPRAGLRDALAPERREAFVLTLLAGLTCDAAIVGPIGTSRPRVARTRAEAR